jgi:hypothetical protein
MRHACMHAYIHKWGYVYILYTHVYIYTCKDLHLHARIQERGRRKQTCALRCNSQDHHAKNMHAHKRMYMHISDDIYANFKVTRKLLSELTLSCVADRLPHGYQPLHLHLHLHERHLRTRPPLWPTSVSCLAMCMCTICVCMCGYIYIYIYIYTYIHTYIYTYIYISCLSM